MYDLPLHNLDERKHMKTKGEEYRGMIFLSFGYQLEKGYKKDGIKGKVFRIL